MKMYSTQFPIKRTNSRGHTTTTEGPNPFDQKSSFHVPKKERLIIQGQHSKGAIPFLSTVTFLVFNL